MGQHMARREYSHVEVKAGVFLAFCLALFVGMLLIYGKIPRLWGERGQIRAAFASVASLKPDAAVLYNGVEVGRVKSMKIVHLDRATTAQLAPMTKRDLDFLPVAEPLRKKLRLVPDYEFDAKVREALVDRTMIVLMLEVLSEGHFRRYRVDDTVRISATILGEAGLEIISGSGRPVEPGEDLFLVGHSGDFFANLARSMEQVKDVLGTVTDVVGAEERVSFKRAAGRLTPILDGIGRIGQVAGKRADATSRRFDHFDESSMKGMDAFNKLFGSLQPDSARLGGRFDAAREDVAKRVAEVVAELDKAEAEVKERAKTIIADAAWVQQESMPHVLEMQEHLRVLSLRADGLSTHLDNIYYRGGRVLERSQPEFARMAAAFKTGIKNLTGPELKYIREKIGEIIGKRDRGEHEYYTALETWRSLERSARGPREAVSELQDLRTFVHNPPTADRTVTRGELDALVLRLLALQGALDLLRDKAAEAMLPPFTGTANATGLGPYKRKRGGRAVYPVR